MRSSPNWRVLNEPRGFIKILEVLIAMFAFSCACGFRGEIKVTQTFKTSSHETTGTFKYPFDTPVILKLVTNTTTNLEKDVTLPLDDRSSTEFFVVIGVFCFLYSLGVLVYYVMFEEDNARSNPNGGMLSLPVIDFCLGAFWTLFWFFSSCAFAAALSSIIDEMNVEKILTGSNVCKGGFTCNFVLSKYATLTVATLLGFLNVFVWAGNIWFLWKETPWHSGNRNAPATMQGAPSGGISGQSQPVAAAI